MHKHPAFWAFVSYIGAELFNRLVLQAEEWLIEQLFNAFVAWLKRNFGGGQQRGYGVA